MIRTYDGQLIDEATKEFQYDFDPYWWIEDDKNIALYKDGDVFLFEYNQPGIYTGHLFCISRGRLAYETAKEALATFFSYDDVEVLRGLTPVEKTAARWFARKLGFRSYGEVETYPGPCELFILTRSEYEKDNA